MPDLQGLYEEYKNKMDFIFINEGETKEIINKYLVEHNGDWTFPIGYDKNEVLNSRFNIMGLPTTIIVDKNKKISDILIGGRSEKEFRNSILKVLK